MAVDKNEIFPIPNYKLLCFLKNIISKPNIEVGDYSYYHDFEDVYNFEKNVKYHFDFTGDKLIIGKFCMIASDVQFIMNGANHLMSGVSTYPFATFGHEWADAMKDQQYPIKGDTLIGNDVWIGYGATIMPGISIGDGAVIATKSVVIKDVPAYGIVGGNPAKLLKMRFDDDKIKELQSLKWWDWEYDKITDNLAWLTGKSS